ncbi:ATP synthase F1 subunit delta [Egicoccus sp. AB-alg6-2]|uniref:ATP synthase F1 subunit delta n=1 Tax=Egicoccus sp. AB-alg6-2 TaxID=3242692 RepID=UPI00359EA70C
MTTERTGAYAQAVVALAEGEGALDAVGNELRTIASAVDASDDLRQRLTDIHLPVGQRLKFVESDVLQAAHPVTRSALAMIIAADRANELTAIADAVSEKAAELRNREVAEVYVAAPLDEPRQRALIEALERTTGKRLDVQVHVDPTVVGGVRAKIGDTVIDGSVARRLQDLRTRVGR